MKYLKGIKVDIVCECGNSSSRDKDTVVTDENARFFFEIAYDTGLKDVIQGLSLTCRECEKQLKIF